MQNSLPIVSHFYLEQSYLERSTDGELLYSILSIDLGSGARLGAAMKV
jgi:hypothetical protein